MMNMNPLQKLFQVMSSRGINISQNMINDPRQITNYLLQNGRITQEQYNNARRQAQQFQQMYPQQNTMSNQNG